MERDRTVRVSAPAEVTPDERAAVTLQLNGLLDVLRKMPAMVPAAGDRWVLVLRNQVPFWAPVTCERGR